MIQSSQQEVDIEAAALPWKSDTSPTTKAQSVAAPYLRGPIPWEWLQRAIELGGGSLATGLAIWHLRALNRSDTFNASLYQLNKWTGLSEKATRSGRKRLEDAGLIRVDRPNGNSPLITIQTVKTKSQ